MNFFRDLFADAATGALTSAARGATGTGIGPVERLCRELGWDIDGRAGDTGIGLHFKDPVFRLRPLYITASNSSELVVFGTHSRVRFPAAAVPAQLAAVLLGRNNEAFFHSWQCSEDEGGTVSFSVWYATPSGGLRAPVFKSICELMCQDVSDLDARLREARLI